MYAGSGFNYLLRTTADAQGGVMAVSHMTAYYAEAGTPPGQWLGNGLKGLAGMIEEGDIVSGSAMEALFKDGRDPDTLQKLGQGFRRELTVEQRVSRRIKLLPKRIKGQARDDMIEKIRNDEATRKVSKPVSGFDFVFSPVKSVSTLWALADHGVREQIYEAHRAALADVIATMEDRVAMTRVGTNGIAQVETRGLIAAAFDHWDARGGDPQLHTHVAVSNRVQGLDGKWRTLDSRGALLPSTVAMSELYNGRIQDHLTQRLGVDWEERASRAGSKGRWFEIRGIPRGLTDAFSSRSQNLDEETDRLVSNYRKEHGRSPSKRTVLRLRQQAQRATRPDKVVHSLRELQAEWRSKAEALGVNPKSTVNRVVKQKKPTQLLRFVDLAGTDELESSFLRAWDELTLNNSVWKRTNTEAAALRATQHLRMTSNSERLLLMDHLVEQIEKHSVSVDARNLLHVPKALQRTDGSSAFDVVGAQLFTSPELLDAESRLIGRSRSHSGPVIDHQVATQWSKQPTSSDRYLTADQAQALEHIAISGRSLDVLVGPAGAGKTTLLSQLRGTWEHVYGAGSVKGLAPSAAAAAVLGDELGITTDNTAKWLDVQTRNMPDWQEKRLRIQRALIKTSNPDHRKQLAHQLAQLDQKIEHWSLKAGDLLIVDEASLAGTLALDRLSQQAEIHGAKVLLVGDWAQLAAVEAGGAFGMLVRDREGTAPELDSIHRFHAEWEKSASIRLRTGDESTLTMYAEHGRIHEATGEDSLDAVYDAWRTDILAGKTSMMIGADNETVSALNRRARADFIADGSVGAGGVELHDSTHAATGDLVVTRLNKRELATSKNSWVKNGDRWIVVEAHQDGSMLVRRINSEGLAGGPAITLPADYVSTSVELAYATTAHRAQGATVDTSHTVATPALTREVLYVAMTRGREANHVYVSLPNPDDEHEAHTAEELTGLEVLTGILSHSGASMSATESIQIQHEEASHISRLIAEYETIAQIATTSSWDQATRAALPELPDTITHSESWPTWVSIMRHVESHGLDLHDVISTLGKGINNSDDPMQVLTERAGVLAETLSIRPTRVNDERFGGILNRATSGDPDLARGLQERQTTIESQIHHAAVTALNERPQWLNRLGPRPSDPTAAHMWENALQGIITYRLIYDVTDERLPLGDGHVHHWRQASHQRRAAWLIDQLHETNPNVAPRPSLGHGIRR